MNVYTPLFDWLERQLPESVVQTLSQRVAEKWSPPQHGDFARWSTALAALPTITPDRIELHRDCVRVGSPGQLSELQTEQMQYTLQQFHPWRKGPFELFGIYIDTEWRSDLKWRRLCSAISPLTGRTVLDVGCGNGYYAWRMAGAGAKMVIGIEPMLLHVMQYQALQRFIAAQNVYVLPLAAESMPVQPAFFDSVFSMGLLYHQRDPLAHLRWLRQWLHRDGELVLETLVVDDNVAEVLVPKDRYASMRNVWSIPSVTTLRNWLLQSGYRNPRLIDVTATTSEEQRRTAWMQFNSLADYLDPEDPNKTIEGYPAPQRAIYLANPVYPGFG